MEYARFVYASRTAAASADAAAVAFHGHPVIERVKYRIAWLSFYRRVYRVR